MTKEELIKRLNGIEWDDFEVKEANGGIPKSMWETVSAFSDCFDEEAWKGEIRASQSEYNYVLPLCETCRKRRLWDR